MEGMQYTLQVPRSEPEMGDGDLIDPRRELPGPLVLSHDGSLGGMHFLKREDVQLQNFQLSVEIK